MNITKIKAYVHFRGHPFKNQFGRKRVNISDRDEYVFGHYIARESGVYIFDGEKEWLVNPDFIDICVMGGDIEKDGENYPIFVNDMVILKGILDFETAVGRITIPSGVPIISIDFGDGDYTCENIDFLEDFDPIPIGISHDSGDFGCRINNLLLFNQDKKGEKTR